MNDVSTAPSPGHATPGQVPFFELSRLMVVAVLGSNSRLVYKAQTKPNGPWEANWSPIDTTQTFGWIAAGITGDGRVAVVGQRASGTPGVSYIDEEPNSIDVERWNAPVDLGKPAAANNLSQLAITADADGRVEVFALDVIGTDPGGCRIWWKYQNPNRIVQKQVRITPPGSQTPITITVDEIAPPAKPWSDWFQLPGGLVTIQAKRNADGRVILFGVNSLGHIYRNEQKVALALQPSDWAGWVRMDDGTTGTFGVFSATRDRLGAINLFAINQGGQILHARQAPPCTSTWTGWSTLGYIREGVQALAAGTDGDDHIVLVATDKTNIHSVNHQWNASSQQWTGWIALNPTSYPPQLALDYNSDGRLSLFSHWVVPNAPPYGGLWVTSQTAVDSTEWVYGWTQLAESDIRQYAVVRDLTPPK
jgi:hypothetical protein